MIEKLNSKIVVLNSQKYLIYLKRVAVKARKKGENGTAIKAFVKRLKK